MQYFVATIDDGRRGREGRLVADVTEEIPSEARLPEVTITETDLQAMSFDHARDLREHEAV